MHIISRTAPALLFCFIFLFSPLPVQGLANENEYVRTANYFLKAGTDIYPSMYSQLARYDVVILPMEAAVYNKEFFSYARTAHPNITLLAYVPSRSINIKDIDDGAGIRKKLQSGILHDWYLRDPSGDIVPAWPGTLPINITSAWKQYLPEFVADTIMSTHLWDGIFYDEVDSGISFLNAGTIDINNDGDTDSKEDLDRSWQSAMTEILSRTRELLGPDALIVINGSSTSSYQPFINGRMFESFPTPWEGSGRWEDSMQSYLTLSNTSKRTPLFIINSNTANTGRNDIYQKVRYGLASALLSAGYFGFDFGTQNHGQLWWYDEFDIHLGKPSGSAYLAAHSTPSSVRPGVWRRDFQRGTALVNSTNSLQEVSLDGEFEKIRGNQDSSTNDGSITSQIFLNPSDGILLLRPLSQILKASYQNGSFARVFDERGTPKRNGFFAYDMSLRGSVTLYDSTDSKSIRRVTADRGTIHIIHTDGRETSFQPFENWRGNLNIEVLESDNRTSVVFASREYDTSEQERSTKKSPSSIAVFNDAGVFQYEFFPLGKQYRGSIRFAIGDLNADRSPEIVVGSGSGTQPVIRIFNIHGKVLSGGFLAYQKTFTGGLFVGIADLKGDGRGVIITSPGRTGSPLIRLFSDKGKALSPGFLAFASGNKGGIRVLGSDVDGDGKEEIIATTTKVFTYATKR